MKTTKLMKTKKIKVGFDSIKGNELFENLVESVYYSTFKDDCRKFDVTFIKAQDRVDYIFIGTEENLIEASAKGHQFYQEQN